MAKAKKKQQRQKQQQLTKQQELESKLEQLEQQRESLADEQRAAYNSAYWRELELLRESLAVKDSI